MTRARNSNYASPDHKPFKDKKKIYEHARNINLIVLLIICKIFTSEHLGNHLISRPNFVAHPGT